MRSNYKKLGEYIELVDVRNRDEAVSNLRGISSVHKTFMKTRANMIGVSLKNYKIVSKNQFAFNPNTARMGDRIPIALNLSQPLVVSSIYPTFKITEESKLLPEYLMMWFRRPEFDRYARFKSHGSAREIFDWDEMCNVELPIPSIEEQQKIVDEYNTVIERIELNKKLNKKLEEVAQSLYKHWFVDFEFPDENGNPFKSSSGKLKYSNEIKKDIPENWDAEELQTLSTIKGGKRLPLGHSLIQTVNNHPYIKVADLGISKFAVLDSGYEYVPIESQHLVSRYIVKANDLILSIVGTIGIVKIIDDSLDSANLSENCVKITDIARVSSSYLYHFFNSREGKEEIVMRNVGAVQAKLPIYNIESIPILCPENRVTEDFNKLMEVIDSRILSSQKDINIAQKLKELLLSSLSTEKVEAIV